MSDEPALPKYLFEQLFLRDLSFETPMGADSFADEWQPEFQINLKLNPREIGENRWEVELVATVSAKLGDKTAYVIEVHYGSVVIVNEKDPDALSRVLAIDVPEIIFPYLREVIDNVATKGGFPAVGLSRPDFAGWYERASRSEPLQAGRP